MDKTLYRHIICLLITLAIAVGGVLSSCGSSKDEPEPTEPPATVTTRRAVLVYMVADNSLGESAYDDDSADLKEMTLAANMQAIPADCRLLVYHVSQVKAPALYEIAADQTEPLLLKSYSEDVLSVTAERMTQVISDFKAETGAREYGMVLWSHASGWLQDGLAESGDGRAQTLSFGISGDYKRKMNITTLANVLAGKGFEFLYFDCCYMASVEALYQLRHCAKRFLASSAELPSEGSRWDLNLECLFTDGKANLLACAENNFNYFDSLTGRARTCTMSVVEASGLEALAAATRAVFAAAETTMPADFAPQKFTTTTPCYYYDLQQYIHAICPSGRPELQEQFDQALAATVTYAQATPKIWNSLPVNYHCGLTVNILTDAADASTKNYDQLEWYQSVTINLFN